MILDMVNGAQTKIADGCKEDKNEDKNEEKSNA